MSATAGVGADLAYVRVRSGEIRAAAEAVTASVERKDNLHRTSGTVLEEVGAGSEKDERGEDVNGVMMPAEIEGAEANR